MKVCDMPAGACRRSARMPARVRAMLCQRLDRHNDEPADHDRSPKERNTHRRGNATRISERLADLRLRLQNSLVRDDPIGPDIHIEGQRPIALRAQLKVVAACG